MDPPRLVGFHRLYKLLSEQVCFKAFSSQSIQSLNLLIFPTQVSSVLLVPCGSNVTNVSPHVSRTSTGKIFAPTTENRYEYKAHTFSYCKNYKKVYSTPHLIEN